MILFAVDSKGLFHNESNKTTDPGRFQSCRSQQFSPSFAMEYLSLPDACYQIDGGKANVVMCEPFSWLFLRQKLAFQGDIVIVAGFAPFAISTAFPKRLFVPRSIEILHRHCFSASIHLSLTCFEANSRISRFGISSFGGCRLMSIAIPRSAHMIGERAFISCKWLQCVHFEPNSRLTSIGPECFAKCGLVAICVPRSVEFVGPGSFGGCVRLSAVAFEENSRLRFLGAAAFAESPLLSIVIPRTVHVVDAGCFNRCRCLERVAFERNSELKSLKDSAFDGTAITGIRIPAAAALDGSTIFPLTCAVLRQEGDV
jgi:hypothetical protein